MLTAAKKSDSFLEEEEANMQTESTENWDVHCERLADVGRSYLVVTDHGEIDISGYPIHVRRDEADRGSVDHGRHGVERQHHGSCWQQRRAEQSKSQNG